MAELVTCASLQEPQMRPISLALLAIGVMPMVGGCGTTQAVGSGGSSSAVAATAGSTTSSSKAAVTNAAASSSSTGTPFVCNPAAAAGSLYEKSADSFGNVVPISMCQYRGDVLLIVDTAAQ